MNPRRKIVRDLFGGDSFWRKRALNPEKRRISSEETGLNSEIWGISSEETALNPEIRRVSSEQHARIGNSAMFLPSNTPKSRILPSFFRATRLNREFRPSFFRETRCNPEKRGISLGETGSNPEKKACRVTATGRFSWSEVVRRIETAPSPTPLLAFAASPSRLSPSRHPFRGSRRGGFCR